MTIAVEPNETFAGNVTVRNDMPETLDFRVRLALVDPATMTVVAEGPWEGIPDLSPGVETTVPAIVTAPAAAAPLQCYVIRVYMGPDGHWYSAGGNWFGDDVEVYVPGLTIVSLTWL